MSKPVLNMFCGDFFDKKYFAQCSMEGRVFEMFPKNQKKSNSQECPKSFPKCPNMLWTSFGVIFSKKIFCPVFQGGSSLRNVFKKIKNFSKIQKCPKSFPKCPNVFWTCFGVIFSKKFFCSLFHGRSSLRNVFKKIKKFSKLQNRRKSFPKCPKVFRTCFGVPSSEFFFAQCSMEGRVFEIFSKNQKTFKIP